jgi:Ankyrin repeats (3 copies)
METPLHRAAYAFPNGWHEIPALLAAPGVDVNARADRGRTPFLVAAAAGNVAAMRLLQADVRVDITLRDKQDMNALHAAAEGRAGDGDDVGPLSLLLGPPFNFDVNALTARGESVLWHAVNTPDNV